MKDQPASSTNVIQFPGRKREDTNSTPAPTPANPETSTTPSPRPAASAVATSRPKRTGLLATAAVLLASVAVNRYVYTAPVKPELATNSRRVASVASEPMRDAAWEKTLSEELSAKPLGDLSSIRVGRAPTMEEKLRWGTLEENYAIRFRSDVHAIESISFQSADGNHPAYLLDRPKFLSEYAPLFNAESAQLKSVEKSPDTTVEAYTLYGKDQKLIGEARFELDRSARLLSLKVEPTQF